MKTSCLVTILLIIGCARAIGRAEDKAGFHALFTRALSSHVQGGLVDYPGFKSDSSFHAYLEVLSITNPESLATRADRLAFWINAYNAYTIKLIIDRMPLKSIKDISLGLPVLFGPWSIRIANVGGKIYTLNEIEHDIIRGKFKDPRIHFALVCAAISCPKLRNVAYEGNSLGTQLADDAQRFISDTSRNRIDFGKKTMHLSKIFDWYESDFEDAAGSVQEFISRYLAPEMRDLLRGQRYKIFYLPYDWMLNSR